MLIRRVEISGVLAVEGRSRSQYFDSMYTRPRPGASPDLLIFYRTCKCPRRDDTKLMSRPAVLNAARALG